jgi:hypothetical protein
MRESPPAQLASLLKRLGLATDRDLQSVESTVHRMAGDLPRFESIWVDALRQTRILTHFQAAEIHAGRGEALQVARYVLCHSVEECGYATIYRAQDRESREIVRLAVFSSPSHDPNELLLQLEKLVVAGKGLPRSTGAIEAGGLDGRRFWASSPWVEGTSLADLVLHHGRFPPGVVLEIARAMLGELVALEAAGLVHGDIRTQNVLITRDGEVHIPHPGLRGVVRPYEGISHHDLAPDACSTLAPERVTAGAPPSAASDLFACGCVWWHTLCGRPPLGGGDTMARLRAAQAAAIDDLHQWVADVPGALVAAIGDCLQKDPRKRPKSMADLTRRLGSLRRHGRQAIARCLVAAARPCAPWLQSKRAPGSKPAHPHRFTAAALAILAAAAVVWPLWVAQNKPQGAGGVPAQRVGEQGAAGRIAPSADAAPREPPSTHHAERGEYNSPRSVADPAVTPAGYTAAANSPSDYHSARRDGPPAPSSLLPALCNRREELRLPSDRPVRGESLRFKPGQRVRAQSGRARIVVPLQGLAVQADRVSFENIDFVADETSHERTVRADFAADAVGSGLNEDKAADGRAIGEEAAGMLIRLLAAECEFTGCSFQSAGGSPELRAAIVWQHAAAQRAAAIALPSGRICMKNCVFRRVGVGVESRVHGAIALEIVNSLHLGPGPMIRLTHAPAADEPVRINLSQVTLREADALLECRCVDLRDPSGEINIEASGCVLAPRAQAALLLLRSDSFPTPLLHEMKWTGQGSVVAGQVVFGRLCGRDGSRQTIDDATISIAGLVRGEVEFAGRFDGEPANSQVVNCQAPLQDSDSAGVAARTLPPEVKSAAGDRP